MLRRDRGRDAGAYDCPCPGRRARRRAGFQRRLTGRQPDRRTRWRRRGRRGRWSSWRGWRRGCWRREGRSRRAPGHPQAQRHPHAPRATRNPSRAGAGQTPPHTSNPLTGPEQPLLKSGASFAQRPSARESFAPRSARAPCHRDAMCPESHVTETPCARETHRGPVASQPLRQAAVARATRREAPRWEARPGLLSSRTPRRRWHISVTWTVFSNKIRALALPAFFRPRLAKRPLPDATSARLTAALFAAAPLHQVRTRS